jgi:hypothetical protein
VLAEHEPLAAQVRQSPPLGDPIQPADAVSTARDALADVDRALGLSVDAIYAAMRHTSRLYEP